MNRKNIKENYIKATNIENLKKINTTIFQKDLKSYINSFIKLLELQKYIMNYNEKIENINNDNIDIENIFSLAEMQDNFVDNKVFEILNKSVIYKYYVNVGLIWYDTVYLIDIYNLFEELDIFQGICFLDNYYLEDKENFEKEFNFYTFEETEKMYNRDFSDVYTDFDSFIEENQMPINGGEVFINRIEKVEGLTFLDFLIEKIDNL